MSFPLMPISGGLSVLTDLTLVGTTSSTSNTIALPTGAATGDLVILIDAPTFSLVNPSTSGGSGIDTSFTTLVTQGFGASFSSGVVVSAGFLGNTDRLLNVLGGMNGQTDAKYLYVLRGNSPINRIGSAKNTAATTTNANPAAQTAVATGVVSPAIVIGVAAADGAVATNFVTTTPAFTNASGSATKLSVGLSTVNESTSAYSQLVDMNDLGTNTLLTFWFEVS